MPEALTSTSWSVLLHDCAVRDEPAEATAGEVGVAAALLVGSLQWGSPVQGSRQVGLPQAKILLPQREPSCNKIDLQQDVFTYSTSAS